MREYETVAPRRNIGLGSCESLAATFSPLLIHNLVLCEFLLKISHLIYTASLTLNSRPTALYLNKAYLTQIFSP